MKTEGLLLNPKLPEQLRAAFTAAWDRFSTEHPLIFGNRAVGLATSGSTSGGTGSIIVLSRKALEASARAVNQRLKAAPADVWGLALPLFHVGGFSIPIRAELSASRYAEFRGKWDVVKFHEWLKYERVTLLSLVPTQLFDLLDNELESPADLRAIVVGGGRLDRSLHDRAVAKNWPVLQSYGMTECCSQVATAIPGSDGLSLETLDHVELRTDPEQILSLRSASLLSARIVFDSEFQPVIEFPVDGEGWFRTTDRASAEGNRLTILGREGDAVKVLGELVDLVRVRKVLEDCASEHPELFRLRQKTWVVALPDRRKENELVLIIEGVEADYSGARDRLLKLVKVRLAPFEFPAQTIFIKEIPRSPLGKILSTLLTETVAELRHRKM